MSENNAAAIGISGYMGSGKSTLAAHCARFGGRLLDVDSIAKQLMNSDAEIRARLVHAFGNDIIEKGSIQFSMLGERAYASIDTLVQLNHIVHPLLLHELANLRATSAGAPCIFDAALIPYWHIADWFKALVWVYTPFDIRLQRYAENNASSHNEFARRMKLQEELFAPPHDSRWIQFDNTGSIERIGQFFHSKQGEKVLALLRP
jgi:dephospho-CoA kinase